jgi:hypothetical protein
MASAQTPSGPTRALASGASVSVDDYEKVRQQIRNEVLPEIRQQLQNEFELFRKEVERDAEGLSTETQMLLHQLIGKLSEMGDDSTGIVNTVSATIHELHLSLQHFKEQQTPLPKV